MDPYTEPLLSRGPLVDSSVAALSTRSRTTSVADCPRAPSEAVRNRRPQPSPSTRRSGILRFGPEVSLPTRVRAFLDGLLGKQRRKIGLIVRDNWITETLFDTTETTTPPTCTLRAVGQTSESTAWAVHYGIRGVTGILEAVADICRESDTTRRCGLASPGPEPPVPAVFLACLHSGHLPVIRSIRGLSRRHRQQPQTVAAAANGYRVRAGRDPGDESRSGGAASHGGISINLNGDVNSVW